MYVSISNDSGVRLPLRCHQVYASYKYRRDFAEVAKAGGALLGMLWPLPRDAASRGAVQGPPGNNSTSTSGSGSSSSSSKRGVEGGVETRLDPPNMRQAVAWEFVLRAIHEREVGDGCGTAGHGTAVLQVRGGEATLLGL